MLIDSHNTWINSLNYYIHLQLRFHFCSENAFASNSQYYIDCEGCESSPGTLLQSHSDELVARQKPLSPTLYFVSFCYDSLYASQHTNMVLHDRHRSNTALVLTFTLCVPLYLLFYRTLRIAGIWPYRVYLHALSGTRCWLKVFRLNCNNHKPVLGRAAISGKCNKTAIRIQCRFWASELLFLAVYITIVE